VNAAMVLAYHEIGEQIYKACGENDRAGYGKGLLQYLSERLTAEFGSGLQIRNLRLMRKFYLMFPNANALRSELSWTHYRLLMRVSDEAHNQEAERWQAGDLIFAIFPMYRGKCPDDLNTFGK